MANSVVKIDTEAFETAISEIINAEKSFENARESFSRISEQAMDGWCGFGEEAFKKVFSQISRKLRDEKLNLDAFEKELRAIKKSYESWDSKTASNIEKS